MTTTEYNFIERYRTLMPAASREVVDARQKAHATLAKDFFSNMNQIYALLALAFQQEKQGPLIANFEQTVHEFDEQFILRIDRAESARIATLLLENAIFDNKPIVATAILATSFCGRRVPAEDGNLLEQAQELVERVGSVRRVVEQGGSVVIKSPGDLNASLDAMVSSLNGQTVRAVVEALLGEIKKTQQALASSATTAIRAANAGLAQEVDMLWWNMGDWSDILKRSRRQLSPAVAGLVAGYELGQFVKTPPGPYGAYGILRHTLADKFDQKTSLKKAVTELKADATALTRSLPETARSLFPVTAAIAQFAKNGKDAWDNLAADLGDVVGVEITYFELAVQAYREAILIGYGGLE